MIRRGNAKKTPSAVNDAENETLSVNKGIAKNAGPNELATVVDSCNFRLRDDGSYALRKPDVVMFDGNGRLIPLKDEKHALRLGRNVRPSIGDMLDFTEAWVLPIVKYTPWNSDEPTYEDEEHYTFGFDYINGDYVDGNPHKHIYIDPSAKPIRAGDVTLIPIRVDVTLVTDLVDSSLYSVGTVTVPRYLSVHWETDPEHGNGWVLEIVRPEMNTLVNDGSGASFAPNLMLDNPYSLRDLYRYGSVGVQGIIAYQDPDDAQSSAAFDSYTSVSDGTVSKTFYDAVFDVRCENGNLYVGTAAHISLMRLSEIFDAANPPTPSRMAGLDDNIVCYVKAIRRTVQGETPQTYPLYTSSSHYAMSAIIPAHVKLHAGAYSLLKDGRASTLSVEIELHAAKGEHSLYAYPGTVSLKDALELDGLSNLTPSANTVTLTFELDGEGNVIATGFDFVYDEKGVHVDVDATYAGAMRYALSNEAFASEDAAKRASAAFVDGGSLMLNASVSSWAYHYKTWDLSVPRYTGLDGIKMKALTERVGDVRFKMIAELSADDERPLILKAAMTFSDDLQNMYGVWESSSDGGVSWQVCDEFLRTWHGRTVKIPVVDATRSNETLQNADSYVKYVRMVAISAGSNEDLATDRVDVLPIWSTPRTRMFRFSVYRYAVPAETGSAGLRCVTGNYAGFPCLDMPSVDGIYMLSADEGEDMYVLVPEGIASGTVGLRFGVSGDVDANISDQDCASAVGPQVADSNGFLFRIPNEQLLISGMRGFTHAVKIRVLCEANGSVLAGYSLNAVCLHTHIGIRFASNAVYAKRMTFPEPVATITGEEGVLYQRFTVYQGAAASPDSDYLEPYVLNIPERSPADPYKCDFSVPDDFGYNAAFIESFYKVKFKIRNPTSLPMPIELCVSRPTQSGNFQFRPNAIYSLDDLGRHQATLTLGSSSFKDDFALDGDVLDRMLPPFERGISSKVIVLKPYETIECSYEQRLSNVASSDYSAFDDLYVWEVFRDTVHPLELVTASGWFGISKSSCVSKTPTYSSHYFHSAASLAYYGEGTSLKPVQYDGSGDVGDFKIDVPLWDRAKNSAYVSKAVMMSTLTYTAALIDKRTAYMPYWDIPDLVRAKHIYYEHLILTYGVQGHGNVLYVSETDSYVTPLQNAIEFSYGSDVTAVIPWRNYIIVFTENSTYMLLKDSSSSNGFSTRTVNSQIGVPKTDGNSVQAILNGILFKSGSKAYVYVPSRYATIDTMLNIKRISDAVDGLLLEGVDTLSFVQDDEWHLFQDDADSTELVYDYARNAWTKHSHAFFPTDSWLHGPSWRFLMRGMDKPTSYGRDWSEIRVPSPSSGYFDLSPLTKMRYGDYLGSSSMSFIPRLMDYGASPAAFEAGVFAIPFSLDTGQRSSRFTVSKQFLELKFNMMSLDEKDAFPLTISVYADGMPHAYVMDANTDSPFWRDSKTLDSGAAATSFGNASTSNVGIMRQMFIKYSGKGKTLRITISGESQSKFAVYTIDSRYRVLPNKQ